MIGLIEPDGTCETSYSDSFSLLEALQDAFRNGYLKANHYSFVWPAATLVHRMYAVVAICYDGTIEVTGYMLRSS